MQKPIATTKKEMIEHLVKKLCKVGSQRMATLKHQDPQNPRQVFQEVVTITIELIRDNTPLYRNITEQIKQNPDIVAPLREMRSRYVDYLTEYLTPYLDPNNPTPPHEQIAQVWQLVIAVLTHTTVYDSRPIHYDNPNLNDQITDIAMKQLKIKWPS